MSLWDARSGRRLWLAERTAGHQAPVTDVHVDAIAGLVASVSSRTSVALVHSLESGAILHAIEHRARPGAAPLVDESTGLPVPPREGRLMRCHLYAGQREQAGLRVPCRLMTLAVVDADATAAADDGDGPAPSSLPSPLCLLWEVGSTPADSSPAPSTMANAGPSGAAAAADTAPWTLDASGPAASGHRLLRTSQGLLSEQAGVVAEIENSAPQGEGGGTAGQWTAAAAARQRLNPWSLRLFDVYTLQPLGRCTLDCLPPGRVPVAISLQRRSELVWWVVLEAADDGQRGLSSQLIVCQLTLPVSPTALRASGARLAPAAAAARRGDLVALAVLRRVLLDGKRVDWWTFDVHRSQHLVVHAMRCAGARLGAASGGVTIAPTPARTEIVDLMGSGPDGEGTLTLPADGGGGAVAEAAAAAAAAGLAAASVEALASDDLVRCVAPAPPWVEGAASVHELRALCPPGAAQPLPALLLEDVTGRLNTEDDMTFCEVRLRSCHADDAPGSAAAASAAATAASSATAMTATADVADANAHQFGGVPNLSAPAAVAAADEAAARLDELANHPPVRGWPSDTQLRGLPSATPAPLTFHRSFSDSLKSAASWRFAVLLDVCGVTIVDWLPKECWKQVPLAERPRDAGVTAPGASSLSERPFLRTGEDF